ncbi:hypothetical protein [Faecalibacterium hattorii]|uniref:hypothetical protein n=1 Tax=Faecalibacterium hattorii TaxID=2935520 RepID=UPI003AAEDE64
MPESRPLSARENTRTSTFACGELMIRQPPGRLKAEEYFWRFFIVSHGCMPNGIEDLRRKAAQGVDVRLIYDDFGSLLGWPG